MACDAFCDKLKGLLNELDCRPHQHCCPPVEPPFPFATVCMVSPPPCLAPTCPQPVKPLQLPCPPSKKCMSQEEAERTRYANFYNNYNIDYTESPYTCPITNCRMSRCKAKGMTVDGKSPACCDDVMRKPKRKDEGCPTGFKPCTMKLTPPCDGHPCGVWCAQVQPCPPKPRKVSKPYCPGPCTRPCCKHWKPKEPPCRYNKPCRAHCYDHPIGIKAC